MAQLQARGGRRSAAPTYQPFKPVQSEALVADPELMRKQIFDVTTGGVIGDSYAGNNVAESYARGNSVATGQGRDFSTGGSPGPSVGNPGSDGPGFSSTARGMGMGMSALGSIAKDGSLAQAGGVVGTVGSLVGARNPGDVAATVAQAAGLPGGAIGIGRAIATGDVSLGVNSALSLANPAVGIANAISGMLGIGTIGGLADSFFSKLKIAAAEQDPANASRGYGPGFGDNSFGGGFGGIDGSDSFRGGSNSGQGGGGYGGGIGQSGGNAAGVGSSRA